MRLFTITLSIIFLLSDLVIAQDFDFSLLSQEQIPKIQVQREQIKVNPPPILQQPEQVEMGEKPIGAILLKTGYLYLGEAILENTVYHVVGARGKPKIPASKVEYAGTDRHDIYHYKRSLPEVDSSKGRFALAKWCVGNQMFDEAIAEFQNCKSYISYPQQMKELDKEVSIVQDMKRSAQRRAIAEHAIVETISSRVPTEMEEDSFDLRSWRTAIDPAVMERFKKDVQPQLLRRCGATDCHGSNSTQEFRLTQLKQKYSDAETTLRNLQAAFDQLDFQQPANSPLLTYPQKEHGGAKAIYTRQTKSQLTPIHQWVQLVPNTMPDFVEKYLAQKRQEEQAEYASIPTQAASRPLSYGPIEQVAHEQRVTFEQSPQVSSPSTGSIVPSFNKEPTGPPNRQIRTPPQIQPKDPFDPNLFNQKYH